MRRTLLPGKPYPLGATPSSHGTNFAIYSENATGVNVCFFDEQGNQIDCVALKERTAFVWHGFIRGVKPGQLYGFRVDGPWEPEKGLRFNAAKLLVDPYAKSITGDVDHKGPVYPYDVASGDDLKIDTQDSAKFVPKSVVVDSYFDWAEDCPPETPIADSVIYETHVRGFSIRNPDVPEKLRGTYAGLAHDASISYLKKLGVTAVELMPVHHFIDEGNLLDKGLRDYWGYNTLGFFAPMARYSSSGETGGQVVEFKEMVKRLHQEGIEVILDVVYNHTCEGNEFGPMVSLKGADNTTYYRTVADTPRHYMDYTGTGNTLNAYSPQVLKLIMDSLRYWVTEMHVDGFRFDLASTLAREFHDVNKLGAFFDIIHQDPIIADVKLIAEPWDVGEGGYQVGNFPVLWAEWNGKYRDTVRRFWKGDSGVLADFAYRLTGSSDLYQSDGRTPSASINFITAHDGFTLCDLVSYNEKHNEANGENNNDGNSNNDSWNMGAEGPTEDEAINALRERQTRNFLATLLLSQGVPMISGGDEIARSQRGNNNGYCQDNELSWHDWKLDEPRHRLLEFTSRLIQLRREHPNLHRRRFFQDRKIRGSVVRDVAWYGTDGKEVSDEVWNEDWSKSIGVLLNGRTLDVTDEEGEAVVDCSFLILVNAAPDGVNYVLPDPPNKTPWRQVLDTENIADPFYETEVHDQVILGGRTIRVYSDGVEASAKAPSKTRPAKTL
ncbi:glycogen operon protein [Bryocella elongata]|uniref:Glycogen operon protein n=1 Tax=Bryocella elongata TaxID=863522 RepID=A0A1H5UHE4_9BACT|nr:glycogen debranching protein GlgX [Bryocella elongata]SEF74473.1 glycogen operon protein [Bryocella elongata]